MQQALPVQQSVRETALAVLTKAAAARIKSRYFMTPPFEGLRSTSARATGRAGAV
jgi:hypothetical protein